MRGGLLTLHLGLEDQLEHDVIGTVGTKLVST
jgi:hypothetical protein